MKKLLLILFLSACAQQEPIQKNGTYYITEFGPNKEIVQTYTVTSFQERPIPPQITFTYQGKKITLKGSYQVYADQ